jgi:hypothetical protein
MSRLPQPVPSCSDARFLNVVLIEYGCVRCQKYHREGRDAEFRDHLFWQSKHGTREVDVYQAIVEAAAK